MTEDEARQWIADCYGARRLVKLEQYAELLLAANAEQNLISKASERQLWSRHIADSAQLGRFATAAASWLDVGSGPGLPGLVLAILEEKAILLVEPRRKRVDFLRAVTAELRLSNARVFSGRIEDLPSEIFQAVTARAYATLPTIFSSTIRFTTPSTIWVLPKGRSAETELAAAHEAWQGVFHVEQSVTDDEARIVIAQHVRPR